MINHNKTIEEIEGIKWKASSFPTGLVKRVYEIRKKKIKDLDSEDLRIALDQEICINVIIPLAFKKIEENILLEANYYPGDLLSSLLRAKNYWDIHFDEKIKFINLIKEKKSLVEKSTEITEEIRNQLTTLMNNY